MAYAHTRIELTEADLKRFAAERRAYAISHSARYLGYSVKELINLTRLVWHKTGGLCLYCGKKLAWPEFNGKPHELIMDHYVPWSRGGVSDLSNLMPACRACDAAKKNYMPEAWKKRVKELTAC